MKKQLLAVAVATAFASTAFAANVDLYGVVDTGLVYSQTEFGGVLTSSAIDENSFTMKSGANSASRFGLKGTEDLGDGYSVEFKLENGFASDTGSFATAGKLFDREARLSVNTPYGTVSFGRMGALTSGAGTYDVFQATGDALDGGYCDYIGSANWFDRARYDNMITLVTPEANGFTGYAQYSFKASGSEEAQVRRNDRYAALGLTYSAGPVNFAVVADTILKATDTKNDAGAWEDAKDADYDDAKALSFGINYDFGVTKAFFGAQYGKNELMTADVDLSGWEKILRFDGYNLSVGAVTPLPCGTLEAKVFYGDYEHSKTSDITAKVYGVALMHSYPLSKRTSFYTGAGYTQADVKVETEDVTAAGRVKGFDVTMGLTHKF